MLSSFSCLRATPLD